VRYNISPAEKHCKQLETSARKRVLHTNRGRLISNGEGKGEIVPYVRIVLRQVGLG
jgi:hypothetical protein